MWTAAIEELDEGRCRRVRLARDGEIPSFSVVFELLQNDPSFVSALVDVVAGAPYRALRWETPPVTRETVGRDFECVLLRSDMLDRRADPAAFAEHFAESDEPVLTFPNLGGDALMVVPAPLGEHVAYAHLAAFLREGPREQVRRLWADVGAAMQEHVGEAPTWLSTAGMGVPWLHVRLDSRPKYYGWSEYRRDR